MIGKHTTTFKELPVSQIELDSNQPRKEYGSPSEQEKLKSSLQQMGSWFETDLFHLMIHLATKITQF